MRAIFFSPAPASFSLTYNSTPYCKHDALHVSDIQEVASIKTIHKLNTQAKYTNYKICIEIEDCSTTYTTMLMRVILSSLAGAASQCKVRIAIKGLEVPLNLF